jgi:chromosome segregation protein
MDAHLERARDICAEIERQLRPLERQATKASTHADLVRDLRETECPAVDDLRSLQTEWEKLAKSEKEADADIELSRYRLSEKERDLAKCQGLLEEKGLFVGDLSEQRRRMQSILERLDAGLLLLEEKGKNLVARLSDLRAKLHQSETRAASRSGELERLSAERGEADARLKALYGQLNEVRREAEVGRKARMAADQELSRLNAELRRCRKLMEDDKAALSKAQQARQASALEQELLGERASQIDGNRQVAQSTLSSRRSRLETLQAQAARIKRDMALADADVDKRVRVLDSRRRELDTRREGSRRRVPKPRDSRRSIALSPRRPGTGMGDQQGARPRGTCRSGRRSGPVA